VNIRSLESYISSAEGLLIKVTEKLAQTSSLSVPKFMSYEYSKCYVPFLTHVYFGMSPLDFWL
jgi:hypothetical protein